MGPVLLCSLLAALQGIRGLQTRLPDGPCVVVLGAREEASVAGGRFARLELTYRLPAPRPARLFDRR